MWRRVWEALPLKLPLMGSSSLLLCRLECDHDCTTDGPSPTGERCNYFIKVIKIPLVCVCVCALRFRMRRLKNMELRAFKSRLYFEHPPSQLCGGEVTGKSSVSRSLWFAGLRPYATQWLAKRCGGGFCFGYGAVDRKSFPLRPAPGRQKRGNTKCFKCWAFQTTPCFHNWWPNCNRCACRHYPMYCR